MAQSAAIWYQNPVWFVLLVSLASLVISIMAFRRAGRKGRAEIEERLVTLSNEINEAFARHLIRSPFAQKLKIADEDLPQFSKKAAILFLHINLLKDVYQKSDVLGEKAIEYWKDWGINILRPWVEADNDLKKLWTLECNSRFTTDEAFIKWLRSLIPLYEAQNN